MNPQQTDGEFLPIILTDINTPWEKVLSLGTPVSFPAKSIICGRDVTTAANGMYFIRNGHIRLSNVSAAGKEKSQLYMGRGTLFNEIPMLHMTRNYIFTSLETTEAFFFPKKLITTDFIRNNPELLMNMLESVTYKLRILYLNMFAYRSLSTFANVCRALYCMHLFCTVKGVVVPRLPMQELSAFLGIHRSSLHKALNRLKDEGIIGSYNKRELNIYDATALLNYISDDGLK